MTTVSVKDEYAEILSSFGNLQRSLEIALQRYTIEQVTAKINELRARDTAYQTKYGMIYNEFAARTASDEAFVTCIERTLNKCWEEDLADWEFCCKGIQDWSQKLQRVLLN
ncbi:MAG: hypothetical protein GY862_07625 [Gammaproteobacteria bacterium]|nr:hypothetical protein [Gammaproteobacteria bacterium]